MIEIEHSKDGITKIDNTGIELRDYFAARAMQGLITAMTHNSEPWHTRLIQWFVGGHKGYETANPENVSRIAYLQADAMIRERVWTSTNSEFWTTPIRIKAFVNSAKS